MKRITGMFCCFVMISFVTLTAAPLQTDGSQAPLPSDVNPDTRNRLPPIASNGPPHGAAAIRLHKSGVAVRFESPLGRALTELAILIAAREHDQPFEWSLHEMEAMAVGLNPDVIDAVKRRGPLAGIGERESFIVQIGREIFGTHRLSSETYARALKVLGKENLVDIVDLMGDYAANAARLTAINQQMPPGWKQFLPLPFTPPDDIFPDSRSRLPWVRAQPRTSAAPAPLLYSRTIAPEGTGPGHIARHGAGLKSLEESVGRRLMALAVLVTAREHDGQYDWTMNEPVALTDGLEPAIIDQVRYRRPVAELPEKEAVLIEFGRELFGRHNVSAVTYARALKAYGERDLVDLVELMARHAADVTLLTVFDQHLPPGVKPLLPIP